MKQEILRFFCEEEVKPMPAWYCRRFSKVVLAFLLALVGSMLTISIAAAQEESPTPPPDTPDGQSIVTTTLHGPKHGARGGVEPDAYVGGPGGQSANVTNSINWRSGYPFVTHSPI